jgi:ferritin
MIFNTHAELPRRRSPGALAAAPAYPPMEESSPMLTQKMQEALNAQINAEYYSAYLYLSMAAYCDEVNYKGLAHWFQIQSQEEMIHMHKFFNYVIDRKGRVILKAIEGPPTAWDSPLAVFEAALKHEQHVTSLINRLAGLAITENDHATHSLLEWFLNEQVEEEATADQVVAQMKLADGNPSAMFILDRELGQRVLTTPAGAGAGA